MAARTRLAQFLTDALAARGETPEHFAQRAEINSSGFYKLLRGEYTEPRQGTIEKIAAALHMSAGELLCAVEAEDQPDLIERAIRARTAEMREAVQDTPSQFWASIIKATFDRAIDGARDMAQMLSAAEDRPVSEWPDKAPGVTSNRAPARHQRPIKPLEPAFA